jgi:hypothetical protein
LKKVFSPIEQTLSSTPIPAGGISWHFFSGIIKGGKVSPRRSQWQCSEKEEFYCRKEERDYLLYWERGGSIQRKKKKGPVVYFRSFLYYLKLGSHLTSLTFEPGGGAGPDSPVSLCSFSGALPMREEVPILSNLL